MAMQAAEFRALGAPRSSLRRQRWSYFQTAPRHFIANPIPGPARSAASRRRLGFCHAKVTQREKSKGAASLQPLVYLARPAGVVRNYSRGLCFRTAFIERSRARAHPRDGILMMQASQDRFREYEHTRRQSMSGFGLRDYRSSRRRIGYARA
jgi:hypothetical protein